MSGLKAGYVRTDTDGGVYKVEDTFWAVCPSHEDGDPGVLDHKASAVQVLPEEYLDGEEVEKLGKLGKGDKI